MNAHNHISKIVADRWQEAVNDPSEQKWRDLAQIAANLADSIESDEPDSMLVPAFRGVYQAAYSRMEKTQ